MKFARLLFFITFRNWHLNFFMDVHVCAMVHMWLEDTLQGSVRSFHCGSGRTNSFSGVVAGVFVCWATSLALQRSPWWSCGLRRVTLKHLEELVLPLLFLSINTFENLPWNSHTGSCNCIAMGSEACVPQVSAVGPELKQVLQQCKGNQVCYMFILGTRRLLKLSNNLGGLGGRFKFKSWFYAISFYFGSGSWIQGLHAK